MKSNDNMVEVITIYKMGTRVVHKMTQSELLADIKSESKARYELFMESDDFFGYDRFMSITSLKFNKKTGNLESVTFREEA